MVKLVAVLRIVDRDVEDLKLLRCAAVEVPGIDVSKDQIAGDPAQPVARQAGIERLIAKGDDHALFVPFPAVELCVLKPHVPGGRVGLESVSAAASLEVDPVQVLRDPNVGLELGDLDRRPVVGKVPDSHDHKLHIRVFIQDVLHDLIEAGRCL